MLLSQVLNALGDLVIKRLEETDDEPGVNPDRIDVGLKYAPKQRIIYDMVNLNQHIQLPTMALSISNIQYDAQRAFNKIMGFTTSHEYLSGGGKFPQPVPIKLTLNFSIISRYERDMDQILTCIFSNFYPYIVISYRHPDLGHEVRCVVMWDGNINFTYPIDTPAEVAYRITADSTFTVLGWIYKNASNPYGMIYNIPTTFTSVSNIFDNYESMKALESPLATDYFVVSGRPQLNNINPYFQNMGVTSVWFNLLGDMFQFVTNMAVSGIPTEVFPLSDYMALNPFVSSRQLSAVYGPFTAVPLPTANWAIINDYNLQFNMPVTLTGGFVEVFAWSPMGIGRLTVDTIRPTFNPYVSGTPEYNSYVEFQWPSISGVEIK